MAFLSIKDILLGEPVRSGKPWQGRGEADSGPCNYSLGSLEGGKEGDVVSEARIPGSDAALPLTPSMTW